MGYVNDDKFEGVVSISFTDMEDEFTLDNIGLQREMISELNNYLSPLDITITYSEFVDDIYDEDGVYTAICDYSESYDGDLSDTFMMSDYIKKAMKNMRYYVVDIYYE